MSEYINNQTLREERLKSIIRKLHEGQSADEVKAAFADMLADVGPNEIVRIEAALVNEGLDPAEIEPLCDVHVAIFQDSLDTQKPPETMPGHPVFTFRAENLGVQRVLDEVAEALDDYVALPRASTLSLAQKAVARLHEYDKHYLRKENLLFPFLEQKGFLGPTQVMWGVHDEIRDMWKTLAAALEVSPDTDVVPSNLRSTFDKLAEAIRSMVYERSISSFRRLWSGLRMLSGWPFAIKAMRLATPMPAWARLGSGHGDEGRVARRARSVALGSGRAAGRHPSVGRTVDGRADRPDAALVARRRHVRG